MSEETNRSEYFIRNLIFSLNQFTDKYVEQQIKDFKQFINNISFSESEKNSLYAKCVVQLKSIENYDMEMYLSLAMSICTNFLNMSTSSNPLKKHTDSRKEKYRQLNLDMEKELMDSFDECLKKNNHTKKQIIKEAIQRYITESDKNKKPLDKKQT